MILVQNKNLMGNRGKIMQSITETMNFLKIPGKAG